MHVVYLHLIQYMEVVDPIFERLILENYSSVLIKNIDLYEAVCKKLLNTFL